MIQRVSQLVQLLAETEGGTCMAATLNLRIRPMPGFSCHAI